MEHSWWLVNVRLCIIRERMLSFYQGFFLRMREELYSFCEEKLVLLAVNIDNSCHEHLCKPRARSWRCAKRERNNKNVSCIPALFERLPKKQASTSIFCSFPVFQTLEGVSSRLSPEAGRECFLPRIFFCFYARHSAHIV